jgi:hypothetical protein
VDWLDVLILALRVALVAVLYLFLLFVVRAAVRGLRPLEPARAQPAANRADLGLRLIVVEAGGSSLEPGQLIEVGHGAVLGRSGQAAVVLADSAISGEHARVMRVGRAWLVSDLDSTNGTRVNDAPVRGEMPLVQGDVLQLGNVRLKVLTH